MATYTFKPVSDKVNFSKQEEEIFKYWNEIDAFKTQLEKTKDYPKYTFYDGPPFATGLPHYGHIAAGTIKDIVTRYWTQNGHHVERRFGWDCHGLPIEFEIDKTLGINTREQVVEMGVKNYNAECRKIVMRFSSEWEQIVSRLGRWIDFRNDYKTLDADFMESVWWVFKQIFDKGLVYKSARIMPYSNGCSTVLSNFEANMNYKDVDDPSVFVTFPIVGQPGVKFVAWTTTPWTLPSNFALVVNPELEYVKVKDEASGDHLILHEERLQFLYGHLPKSKYEIVEKIKGADLLNLEYEPLFNYFKERKEEGCFKVIPGSYVSATDGTAIVHCSPGFGEQDLEVAVEAGIANASDLVVPVDDDGRFTDKVTDFAGLNIRDANDGIKEKLKSEGRMIASGTIRHSYPFCWRSETPLIYKAVSSWFINVTSLKEQLLENNKKARWVPAFVQEKRFHNWLEDARDWCFSRNRYWGNPIPLWVSADGEEVVCVGSIEELHRLSGRTDITDLHRENIDDVVIPSQKGKGDLRRIDEVFDCWFESGSMPFAQSHYPFSTSPEEFEKGFPADFIAEGLDQTRGWFYTLNVISTAVTGKEPFKNLIVNGLVLAEDGKKMSKKLKNYPDPMLVVNEIGADAIRLYLVNSPLVRAEPLRFSKKGVQGVVKDVFLPWYNAYRFLVQNVTRYEMDTSSKFTFDSNVKFGKDLNIMDKWIIASCQHLLRDVRTEMENYRLYTVMPRLVKFLGELTNWFVRLNRNRLKGEVSEEDWRVSLNVLYDVLMNITILMSPFTPFITDAFFQNLRLALPEGHPFNEKSIHFLQVPKPEESLIDEDIERRVSRMQAIVEIGRVLRERKNVSLKTPLNTIKVIHADPSYCEDVKSLEGYIKDELNLLNVVYESEESKYADVNAVPNFKLLGETLGAKFDKEFKTKVAKMSKDDIEKFKTEGKFVVNDFELTNEHIVIQKKLKKKAVAKNEVGDGNNDVVVLLNFELDDNLREIGRAREVINRVQKARKSGGINIEDDIVVFYDVDSTHEKMAATVNNQMDLIKQTIKVPFVASSERLPHFTEVSSAEFTEGKQTVNVVVCMNAIRFDSEKLHTKFSEHGAEFVDSLMKYLRLQKLQNLRGKDKLTLKLDDKTVELTAGEDFIAGFSK